ncbi:MAG: relaxase/mobilization nuclease domain-containing protein [Acutalibacteraceae bacterium]|nr:relaxase/mobilization nuclease domain-containing protein [Acutalibacteraceae bacterium]
MATFTAIPEKTQTATAMKRVLDYVMQDKKTVIGGIKLVSGQHCVPESAYQEFMATKHQYGKAKGVFFKQYVQSFKPDCNATPEQIHRIGLETAKLFDGFEVVVATHIDRDHWHNHFVVNSVNCETGYKIQIDEKGLEELRHKSDAICQKFGLEVLTPYQKPKQKSINQREYRTALRGDSKKLKLTNAIDYAVATSRNKKQFIEQMDKLGYGVKWIDHYKYITYTTPDGQRFRDNRLLDDKYLKTNMEKLFAYGYYEIKEQQSNRTDNRGNGSNINQADTTSVSASDIGTVQQNSGILFDSWEQHCKKHGFNIRIANASRFEQSNAANAQTVFSGDAKDNGRQAGLNRVFNQGQIIEADGILERATSQGDQPYDERTESQGFDTVEVQAEMGSSWGNITIDALYLAADITMIGETDNNDKHKPKFVRERKRGQKKQQNNNDSNEMQLKM